MEQVLSAQPPRENEIDRITFRNKTNRSRQESKIVRMKVPAQRGHGGQDRVRSKVNFQFVSKTTTSRPPGLPYVFTDILGDYRPPSSSSTVASPAIPANYPSVQQQQQRTPANTRRYAQRFPVRPAPVTGVAGTAPWRSAGGTVPDSKRRFPF